MIMSVDFEIINRPKHSMCAQLTLCIEREQLLVESDFNAYRLHSLMCAVLRWWFRR